MKLEKHNAKKSIECHFYTVQKVGEIKCCNLIYNWNQKLKVIRADK